MIPAKEKLLVLILLALTELIQLTIHSRQTLLVLAQRTLELILPLVQMYHHLLFIRLPLELVLAITSKIMLLQFLPVIYLVRPSVLLYQHSTKQLLIYIFLTWISRPNPIHLVHLVLRQILPTHLHLFHVFLPFILVHLQSVILNKITSIFLLILLYLIELHAPTLLSIANAVMNVLMLSRLGITTFEIVCHSLLDTTMSFQNSVLCIQSMIFLWRYFHLQLLVFILVLKSFLTQCHQLYECISLRILRSMLPVLESLLSVSVILPSLVVLFYYYVCLMLSMSIWEKLKMSYLQKERHMIHSLRKVDLSLYKVTNTVVIQKNWRCWWSFQM